jgi:hypothetical protein
MMKGLKRPVVSEQISNLIHQWLTLDISKPEFS